MATFTVLGDAELADLAAAFGLGAVHSARAIAAGTINSNFELHTERAHYFARVNEGKSEADVAWEARLVSALAEHGVPTPPPLAARDGRPYAPLRAKWVSVFPWRDGRHLAADEVTPARAATFGATLAQLHVAGLALPAVVRRGSIYDHAHLVRRYERIAAQADPALAHAVAILGEELAAADAAAKIRERATHGLIHGDLFRDNVLWSGEGISAVLDFEQASGGSLAYDLAVCINDWCWPDTTLAASLIAGYQRVRPLLQADKEALSVELRASAARFTITRITDVYLARVDNPDKDFRAFLARCEGWRGPLLGQVLATL